MLIPTVLWSIWCERNTLIFHQRETPIVSLKEKIQATVGFIRMTFAPTAPPQYPPLEVSWATLPDGTMCLDVDVREVHILQAEILALLYGRDWNYSVNHLFREWNKCINMLAKLGSSSTQTLMFLQQVPVGLSFLLQANVMYISFSQS
ncbi:hypothetical protein VNO78_18308 [Psophocarpus tetragonolobus]|uniref:RNase H type-1 domain-containing protein n=1 Tax=Psophocarpus tetragonolobus TaxID=3891 RepID=A0AAN9SIJ6_PSOTE